MTENTKQTSIFGLDNIKQFGKLEQNDDRYYNFEEDKYVLEYTPLHHQQYLTLKENEYPILLYNDVVNGYGTLFYITNIIDGLILDNDEILFLILFAIKIRTFPQPEKLAGPHYMPLKPFIKYLIEHDFIDSEISGGVKLDKSLKRYFDCINDNKTKANKYNNLLEIHKELKEKETELFEKILKLEKESYNLFEKITELENFNIQEKEYNNNILEEKNQFFEKIIELEKDIYNTQEEKNKLLDKISKLEKDISIIQKENNIQEQNNKLNEENNMQKIIIKDLENKLLIKDNELEDYKNKYNQIIKKYKKNM
jgi:hypothetical protein